MSRRPRQTSHEQLSLLAAPPTTPVRLHRPHAWPAAADDPTTVLARARAIADEVSRRGVPLALVAVTANRRTWLSVRRHDDGMHARVHWRLLEAPALVVDSLCTVARSGRLPRALHEHIGALPPLPEGDYAPSDPGAGSARGAHHDLFAALERAGALLDDPGRIAALTIAWGRRSARRRRPPRSLRLGRLTVGRGHISVHPVLDASWVPSWVVDVVVYHEVCHWVAPPLDARTANRRGEHRIHHRAFRTLETRHPRHHDAEAWIATHLDALLRAAIAP